MSIEQPTNEATNGGSALNDELERLRNALMFYANADNYWSAPLSLDENYDRITLHAVRSAEKHNKVLVDRGEQARSALWPSNAKLSRAHDDL